MRQRKSPAAQWAQRPAGLCSDELGGMGAAVGRAGRGLRLGARTEGDVGGDSDGDAAGVGADGGALGWRPGTRSVPGSAEGGWGRPLSATAQVPPAITRAARTSATVRLELRAAGGRGLGDGLSRLPSGINPSGGT